MRLPGCYLQNTGNWPCQCMCIKFLSCLHMHCPALLSILYWKEPEYPTVRLKPETLQPMFPLIFQSLCTHKISFVQYLARTRLYLERSVLCGKIFFGRNIYVRPSHGSHAHAHSLEGTCIHLVQP